ncbi:Ig-like domain-containing protein, partial [Blautia sp. SF-50]|uniref:Ig-like domain-containing protein n=1 Tax=Blautia sp. SF-50 TaxID=1520805 RepID=UPI000B87974D
MSMKRFKKASIIFLMFMLLSVIAMPVSASAAKLNKKSISLNVGKTYTLKATGTKGKITWTSSKKSVATVSSKGVVKAKKKGTAVIAAKYGKKKLTCKVTVKQPVKSIKLNKTSATLKKGKSLTLKATISPSSANNKAVTWTSSNKKVATVSSKGVVKAVGNGTATITVKAKDGSGKKATCKIT